MNKEQWIFKKHNNDTVEVVSTTEFQRNLKDQLTLQYAIESLSLPTDPNVELVKKIHQQLPITNWAWTLTRSEERRVGKDRGTHMASRSQNNEERRRTLPSR